MQAGRSEDEECTCSDLQALNLFLYLREMPCVGGEAMLLLGCELGSAQGPARQWKKGLGLLCM